MKKIILFFYLCLFSVSIGYSALVTVHGTVLTSKDKTAIVGAIVKDKSSDTFATTDVEGKFTISVEVGSSLEITSLGYSSKSVKVKSDDITVYLSNGKDRNYKLFYTLTGGLEYISETFKDNMSAGLMMGMYWKDWGWYAKASLPIAFETDERDALMGAVLTIGAVKNITDNFRIYVGTGFGLCLYGYYNAYTSPEYGGYYPNYYGEKPFEWEVDGSTNIGIPAELGVQWNYKHLNLTAGFQYVFNTHGHVEGWKSNMSPYLGIGYTY